MFRIVPKFHGVSHVITVNDDLYKMFAKKNADTRDFSGSFSVERFLITRNRLIVQHVILSFVFYNDARNFYMILIICP